MPTNDALSALPPPLQASMERRGYAELTSVQLAVVEHVEGQRNLRISSETGSGKTVALGLALAGQFTDASAPAREKGDRAAHPEALIITPTRELAQQVREELEWLYEQIPGCTIEAVTGGTSIGVERRALARGPRLIVATPGRLLDHLRAGAIDCAGVRHVVLDEADQMLDMGFRDDLEAIVATLPEERRSHLVSATFPPQVRALADRFQKEPVLVQGTAPGAAHEDIEHIAIRVRPADRYAALVNLLLTTVGKRTLIFVRRRVDTTDLAERLAEDGFSVLPLSGDLPQPQRVRTLQAFKQGIVDIIVATDVAARGIDVADITTVVQADPPDDPEVYIHRSGRTGRAGRKGRSVLLVSTPAERRMRALLRAAGVEPDWQAPLSAEKTRRAVMKQSRRRLHEQLDAGLAPSQAELEYAGTLLQERDPNHVVAVLLALSAPKLPREPMSPAEPRPPRERSGSGEFVAFRATWGRRDGATPERVLAHLCRRGSIPSSAVGAIAIEDRSTRFEIAADVATGFETRTRRPDPREPNVRIQRQDGGGSRDAPPTPARKRPGPAKPARDRRPQGRPRSTHRGK